jgi:predicted enzyme related to lactoylglutathione lyase
MKMMRLAVVLAMLLAVSVCAAETFDHVHLSAPEGKTLEAAQWYAKHFGGTVGKSLMFDCVYYGEMSVKFKPVKAEIKPSVGSGVDHIGFSMEDVPGKIQEIVADGGKIAAEMKRHADGKFDYAFVTDPWGTKIELINDPELRGFHHVHLSQKNREAALVWFKANFGGDIVPFKNVPALPCIYYGKFILAIREATEPPAATEGRAVDHIGFRTDNLDALVAKLRDGQTKFVVEPRAMPQYGLKLAFIETAGGVKIELQQKMVEKKD